MKDNKKRLIKLNLIKQRLEDKSIIKTWIEYEKLTFKEKDYLKEDWDKYFNNVKETKAYKRYIIQRKHLKNNNVGLVREFSKKANEQISNQSWEKQKPALEDPIFLLSYQDVKQYQEVLKEIKSIVEEKDIVESLSSFI